MKAPRVRERDREASKVRFTSSILPPDLRKARSIEDPPKAGDLRPGASIRFSASALLRRLVRMACPTLRSAIADALSRRRCPIPFGIAR